MKWEAAATGTMQTRPRKKPAKKDPMEYVRAAQDSALLDQQAQAVYRALNRHDHLSAAPSSFAVIRAIREALAKWGRG